MSDDQTFDIVDVIKALRKAGIHSAKCTYSSGCASEGCLVVHVPGEPCTCWVAADEIKVIK